YYGEGEYIHDCRELWYHEDGSLTWRGAGLLGVYCTHSLGPLLYVTGDRVASVSALAVPGGKFDPRVTSPTMDLLHLTTVGGVAPAPIDVYCALDYTLPGICARQSAARCGAPVAVPDPRQWAN